MYLKRGEFNNKVNFTNWISHIGSRVCYVGNYLVQTGHYVRIQCFNIKCLN